MRLLIVYLILGLSFSHLHAQKKFKSSSEKPTNESNSDPELEPGPPPELVDEEGYSKVLEITGTLKQIKKKKGVLSSNAFISADFSIKGSKSQGTIYLHPSKKVSKKKLLSLVNKKVSLKCNSKVEEPSPEENAPMEMNPETGESKSSSRKYCEVTEIQAK